MDKDVTVTANQHIVEEPHKKPASTKNDRAIHAAHQIIEEKYCARLYGDLEFRSVEFAFKPDAVVTGIAQRSSSFSIPFFGRSSAKNEIKQFPIPASITKTSYKSYDALQKQYQIIKTKEIDASENDRHTLIHCIYELELKLLKARGGNKGREEFDAYRSLKADCLVLYFRMRSDVLGGSSQDYIDFLVEQPVGHNEPMLLAATRAYYDNLRVPAATVAAAATTDTDIPSRSPSPSPSLSQ